MPDYPLSGVLIFDYFTIIEVKKHIILYCKRSPISEISIKRTLNINTSLF